MAAAFKLGKRGRGIAEGQKARVNHSATEWPPPSRTKRRPPAYHFWIVVALMVVFTLAYYLDQTSLGKVPPFSSDLLIGVHDFQRTLFLLPITYATVFFRLKGSIITSLLFLGIVLPRALFYSSYPDSLVRALVFVLLATLLSLTLAIMLDRIAREREQPGLRRLVADTLRSQEDEKRRLARELHDESLQGLVDISHDIDSLSEMEDMAVVRAGLKRLRGEVDSVVAGIRQFVSGLRPPLLDEMGLESSLTWLGQRMSEGKGPGVEVSIEGEPMRLAPDRELNLFRIAQEAMQNARKHSGGSRITVRLVFAQDKVQLMVRDNGNGFWIPPHDNLMAQGKFGLIGMAERARLIGGTLRIESSDGNGTVVVAEVPSGHGPSKAISAPGAGLG